MTSFPSCLLPDSDRLQLDALSVEHDQHTLTLMLSSIALTAVCPICSTTTRRVHNRYQRYISDLAWADVPVRIVLGVRRFFCDAPDCPRRMFPERLPMIVQPWAHRTTRLAAVYHQLGLIASGVGGAALSTILTCPIGIDGLLDLLRHSAPDPRPTPRVLGVDDWALRKGQRYGTILVDHERGQVVELLPDRTPQILAQWLREHPGVEIVTRDRAKAYAQGMSQGAPDALHIADRFHLFKSLTDALTSVLLP